MNCLLVRVGADQGKSGGLWNGPVDMLTRKFLYVAIPETRAVHPGLQKPYAELVQSLAEMGVKLPAHLQDRHMHLDPDFSMLTYGDQGKRAKRLKDALTPGDMIVFYAGLRSISPNRLLVYAIIGVMVVKDFINAIDVPQTERDMNAHSRRILELDAKDLIVRAEPGVSGRLRNCLPIGNYRNRAYRIYPEFLKTWGGLDVNDGYVQRSAHLPRMLHPEKFKGWLEAQCPELIQVNN